MAGVAPAEIRGRLVVLIQMAFVSGILPACLVNWSLLLLGAHSWRYLFAAAVPSLTFFISLFCVPESPRWPAEKDRPQQALDGLTRVGGQLESTALGANVLIGCVNRIATVLAL